MDDHRAQRRTRWRVFVTASIGASLLPAVAVAFTFKPTPSEWAFWPDYCKARYVTLDVGKKSPYAQMVPPAMVQRWESLLGHSTFVHVHHHCAGLIYTQRASVARTDQERSFLWRTAENESKYTLERMPVTSPIYREVAGNVRMAQAMRGVIVPTPH